MIGTPYFEELHNPIETPFTGEAEARNSEVDYVITQAKLRNVFSKFLCGKPSEVDDICPECLKSLDIVGLVDAPLQQSQSYVSLLTWEHLRILSDELEQGTGEREVWVSLLRLLPSPPGLR